MLRLLPVLLVALSAMAAAAEPSGYTLNGKSFPLDAEMAGLPQCRPVTLDLKDRPADEVIAEISKQAGYPIEWEGMEKPPVTVSAGGAPVLHLLAELCRERGWDFEQVQGPEGMFLQVEAEDDPIRAYAAKGPLLVVWYGLTTVDQFDFSANPPATKKVTKFRLGLIADPLSHINAVDRANEKRFRDLPIAADFGGGRTEALNSDHDPAVFRTGPAWELSPREGLAGKAALSLTIPFEAPGRLAAAVLPWAEGSKSRTGEVEILLEKASGEKKKVRDKEDFFKEVEVQEFKTTFRLLHEIGLVRQALMKEGRQPTEGEMKLLQDPGRGQLAGHTARLTLADGTVLDGRLETAAGVSSPWDGYRYQASFRSPVLDGPAPREIRVEWSEGMAAHSAAFRIEEASFDKR